ncbi:MAG: amidohydrolase family protein [Anaerolineales bacterium]
MKKLLSNILIGLLLILGLALLYLTNTGVISFGRPYIRQISSELPEVTPLVAFENVNLIPMDRERVVENQTVIVRDGLIAAIGNSDQVSIPDGALVIDGRGQYLMPGLTDMHVHIQYENDMLLLVANGVTSVRNMWGNTGKMLRVGMPDQLKLREQIQNGELLGPTIYSAGPTMEGKPAFHPLAEVFPSPEAASQSVSWQKAQGYDFVKVYDHLSLDTYQAILDTARGNSLPVVGHVPFAVGLDGVLAGGQETIEHLTGYIDPDAAEFIIPEDQLAGYAQKTHESGVWNCVTLSVYPKSKETPQGFQRLQNQVGMRYVSPGARLPMPFIYMMAARAHTYQGADYPQRIAELNRRMVSALHQAGAGILLGTDAAQPYHIPGFSIHEELEMLVDAGLSPYEALEAGTRNAALALGKGAEFGTVEVGKRADLILVGDNPLTDVGNLQERSGVMLLGRWITDDEIQTILEGIVESYKPNLLERVWPLALIGAGIYLIWRRKRSPEEVGK